MTVYVMEAKENYAPAFVTAFDGGGKLFDNEGTYQNTPGSTFDYVRRQIVYNAAVWNSPDNQTNDTGFNLWSGQNLIAPGGAIDLSQQKNLQICTKSIDTETVVFSDCFGPSKTVPNGLQFGPTATLVGGSGYVDGIYLGVPLTGGAGSGANATIVVSAGAVTSLQAVYGMSGYAVANVLSASNAHLGGAGGGFSFTLTGFAETSDGTWRRFVESTGEAQPTLIDPRTGNAWLHVDSFAANDVCTVYLFRVADGFQQVISPLLPTHVDAHMEPIGISDAWVYVIEESLHLTLTPRTITAAETANDFLLAYANFDLPASFSAMLTGPNSYAFTQNQTVYFLKMGVPSHFPVISTSRAYELWRFDEPSSAPYGGPIVGGGFTNVTPWAAGTGPNTNAASYTYNTFASGEAHNFPTFNFVYYLPGTNQLAIISKFFSGQTAIILNQDPVLTFFDCTYYDIAGATFDYHHGFVTGYMKADWTVLASSTDAAWVVIDALQLNAFQAYNTYVFSGVDYAKVWFAFIVQPYEGVTFASDPTKWHTIFVEYQMAYGSAPVALQVIAEAGWDSAYPAYATAIGNANVVWNSQGVVNEQAITDSGVYDPTANSFWWGGNTANLFELDAYFLAQQSLRASPPFLKLSLRQPIGPGAKGNKIYNRFGGRP